MLCLGRFGDSSDRFRSYVLLVMSQARFHCATLLVDAESFDSGMAKCLELGSNQRPPELQSGALPTELSILLLGTMTC